MEKLSFRIGNVELHTCDYMLCQSGDHVRAEIVVWQECDEGITCATVASWVKTKEGFELSFVGDRPFIYCDPVVFFKLAKVGQDHLDNYFDELEKEC